jgi:quercetin dioxygenase-like cupin family protein
MDPSTATVTRWPHARPFTSQAAEERMKSERLSCYRWSNRPGDVYPAHDHPYHKVIFVLKGSITFGLPATDEQITLNAGDRLDLPAGIAHNAVVGRRGVVCLEGHRRSHR